MQTGDLVEVKNDTIFRGERGYVKEINNRAVFVALKKRLFLFHEAELRVIECASMPLFDLTSFEIGR